MSVKNFNVNSFDEALNSGKTVVADFFATWCMPCRMQAPIIDEIAEELSDSVIVGKVNVDECQEIAGRYSVMSIPTIIVFKNGQVSEQKVGLTQKSELLSMIKGVRV